MPKAFYYIIFAFLTAATAAIIIPKKEFKKYFIYGLIFGASGDTVIYNILNAFDLVKYKNFGELWIWGDYCLATPLTWMFAFMCFLYLLPTRRGLLIIYIAAWSVFNYSVGIVMKNYGMFSFAGKHGYWMLIIFAPWYALTAYIFRRLEQKAEA